MKQYKRIWSFLLLLIAVFLVGCSGGIRGDDAKAYVRSFLNAIESEKYEEAQALLHEECFLDLEQYLTALEETHQLDFQEGIEIERYTGVSSSYYHSDVGGSTYTLQMKLLVGEREAEAEIQIVENEHGYGIYDLTITP